MKKGLGIARCGLACCLCSENEHCGGCDSGNCLDTEWCENIKCSKEKILIIVSCVKRIVGRDSLQRSNLMGLLCLRKDMVLKLY